MNRIAVSEAFLVGTLLKDLAQGIVFANRLFHTSSYLRLLLCLRKDSAHDDISSADKLYK